MEVGDIMGVLGGLRYVLIALNMAIFLYAWFTLRKAAEAKAQSGAVDDDECNVVLLVTAHPDDEVMFFLPTLLQLRQQGREVYLLCLSKGREEGTVREKELEHSCRGLGLHGPLVGPFRDGPDERWPAPLVAAWVDKGVAAAGGRVRAVLTFDAGGVSGHPNHAACSAGVRAWQQGPGGGGAVLELRSAALWAGKYLGSLGAAATLLLQSEPDACFYVPGQPLALWRRMRESYSSQLTWYRQLYALASRYAVINSYTLVH